MLVFSLTGSLYHFFVQLGDITHQGYLKKRKMLLDSSLESAMPEMPSASSIGGKLRNTDVQSTLEKLFNKRPNNVPTKEKGLSPSSAAVNVTTRSIPSSSKRKRDTNAEKAITVVLVKPGENSTRLNKHLLRVENRMKYLLVSPSDTKSEVLLKLQKLFDKPVTLLRSTKSGDLFEITEGMNGDEVLGLVGSGCLHVSGPSEVSHASVKPHAKKSSSLEKSLNIPVLINPKIGRISPQGMYIYCNP